MAAAIVIENLIKRYGATAAVDGVGLEVAEGEVFCLLGPNGAGKTTLIEILEGHRRRTSGEVHVLGFDPETGAGISASASASCCKTAAWKTN